MKVDKMIFDRIDRINWFTNCGAPLAPGIINQNIAQVDNWEQAKTWYSDSRWEDTTLEARNTLTAYLYSKYPNKYSEWNKIVIKAKGYIESSLSEKLRSYEEKYNLGNSFIDCVKWDVLHAIMEFAYSDCKKTPRFFLDLILVYENGNFPCGWDGDYPVNGKLVVY
ncbi:hypothetical protein YWY31_57720 [Paenibacillus illinoisensis]|uniref:hypothetical protein n=1 Tax=Paenibacillus illinoisensis TaxID=59845 RepID=UPI0034C290EF